MFFSEYKTIDEVQVTINNIIITIRQLVQLARMVWSCSNIFKVGLPTEFFLSRLPAYGGFNINVSGLRVSNNYPILP